MPSTDAARYEWPGGLTWLAHPDEPMQRASHALAANGAVWLIDPLDVAGIHDELEERGEVAGVVVLLDRHTRDAAAFAERYDVSVHVPANLTDAADSLGVPVERFDGPLADTGYRVRPTLRYRWWREAALVSDDAATLIVPEALGTNAFYRAAGERVGVHPGLRLLPPRRQLAGLDPDRLLVGHGAPVLEDAGEAVRNALAGSRRRAPQAFLNALAVMLRS